MSSHHKTTSHAKCDPTEITTKTFEKERRGEIKQQRKRRSGGGGGERRGEMEISSREARRKKIMERESDRLALITGRIQSLPASHSTSSQQPRHCHTASTPSFPFQDYITASPDGEHSDALGSRGNAVGKVEHPLRKCETSVEFNRRPPLQVRAHMQPVLVTSMVKGPSSEPPGSDSSLFTPKQISSCIMASENTRAISSAMIALLVVLSYIDYTMFGRNIVSSESVITSRPLYMLLLTDVTIVLGRLVLEKRRGFVKVEGGERAMFQEDAQTWAGAVKVLETGLVVHQSIRAIFIDCSIYAVLVVCGLSLL
ncbi:hypothetical protein VitviT2T_013453 [Vitis vinifera]|uniref:Uncharacterized protein n=2 Tax=Vitis vinifera TaxID=29760 RepID=A0ABY9CJ64_VITVI|nr:hypothetical protein VitviT2T_013453 [Vitis vinifera]